ncbi:ArsR/SmtB family transcription factor [Aureimonas leprariae]|uniref:Metalloregulator ArsR/SmtB family transcription factor n=1 Tax=Plantimonas leprariae TaxID=2615207 RepID=A0A7V7TXF3_9HYPH|nr:metalloregulator ArsR/SmtB family transcription factor [Aureimonas leprariae]KAB0680807.1 metalloregulator ArsR/SmtB family transcription factor [Aureimonas leprariae]
MLDTSKLSFAASIEVLKALGEPTRLRLVRLLASHDLTVSDLTSILGQSQPRISRHLRLLVECGVLTRYQEGAWAYFRSADALDVATLTRAVVGRIAGDDPMLARDLDRLEAIRRERAARAADYFARNAERWDRLRLLHVADADVEAALLEALGEETLGDVLDVGTGTGRLLELLAPRAARIVGVDASREMLQVARAKLDAAGIANAQVRQGDAYSLPLAHGSFDLVTLHQVLHYLDDPGAAVREAARMLRPAGRLAIVDFAPHGLEFLREEQAHVRLGFSQETLAGYLGEAELDVVAWRLLVPGVECPERLTVVVTVAQDRRRTIAADASSAAQPERV